MAKNPNDNIEKAIAALQTGLDIADSEEMVIEVPDKTVEFEQDVEITEMADGALKSIPIRMHPWTSHKYHLTQTYRNILKKAN